MIESIEKDTSPHDALEWFRYWDETSDGIEAHRIIREALEQRDALLKACRELLAYVESPVVGGRNIAEQDADGETVPEVLHARAAIAKAEEGGA
jgi:hypothetical protein